jgi:hypothetical protein
MHDVNVPQYKIHKKLGDYLHLYCIIMHDVNVPQYKIHKKLGDYLHEPVVVGPEGGGWQMGSQGHIHCTYSLDGNLSLVKKRVKKHAIFTKRTLYS